MNEDIKKDVSLALQGLHNQLTEIAKTHGLELDVDLAEEIELNLLIFLKLSYQKNTTSFLIKLAHQSSILDLKETPNSNVIMKNKK